MQVRCVRHLFRLSLYQRDNNIFTLTHLYFFKLLPIVLVDKVQVIKMYTKRHIVYKLFEHYLYTAPCFQDC